MSIEIIDGQGVSKFYETIGDGTVAKPFQSVVPSATISYAENEIFKTYGDRVSVFDKGKRLIKFGKNPDLDSGVKELIWNTGGTETYKTSNDIDIVVSTNVADTQNIVIEGHTISGTDLTFVVQTATLNGTTPVNLTTPLARVSRLYNNDSTDFAGDVTVEDNGTSVHLTVRGTNGENQSRKAQTSISSQDYFIMYQISAGIIGSVSASINFELQQRQIGKVWRTVREFKTNDYIELPLYPPIIIPKNTDIRVVGTSDTNNTEAIAEFAGYLASIQS